MRYAVITTAGVRECLRDCVNAIAPQVEKIFLIDNSCGKLDKGLYHAHRQTVVRIGANLKPPNLSYLWNLGLDSAARDAEDNEYPSWRTAVLNDDAIVRAGWFAMVSEAMDREGAAAGCSGPRNVTYRTAAPVPVGERMTGWAFILDGLKGLRVDEQFHWYFGDDDLAWRAAEAGGMTMISSLQTQNLFPNGSFTPELHVRTAIDAQNFVDKWGQRPW